MTAALAIAKCRALYPAVTTAAASDDFLGAWYPELVAFAGESWFGDQQLLAMALLLAHIAYREDPSGVLTGGGNIAAGPVTSVSTLGMSASFANSLKATDGAWEAELKTTRPGQRFLALRSACMQTPTFVTFCE